MKSTTTRQADDDPPVRCWHTEAGSPCDWDICRQPERLAAGDAGTDPALREEPWTMEHQLHVLIQTEARVGLPNDKGERWVERRLTGKAIAACSCGYTTGLIDSSTLPPIEQLAAAHPRFANAQVTGSN